MYANLNVSNSAVQELYKAIHLALQQQGVNQVNYASHSFEIGVTTTVAAAGLPT